MNTEKEEELIKKVDEIYNALCGIPLKNKPGIIDRVEDLEKFKERLEKKPQNIQLYLTIIIICINIFLGVKIIFGG